MGVKMSTTVHPAQRSDHIGYPQLNGEVVSEGQFHRGSTQYATICVTKSPNQLKKFLRANSVRLHNPSQSVNTRGGSSITKVTSEFANRKSKPKSNKAIPSQTSEETLSPYAHQLNSQHNPHVSNNVPSLDNKTGQRVHLAYSTTQSVANQVSTSTRSMHEETDNGQYLAQTGLSTEPLAHRHRPHFNRSDRKYSSYHPAQVAKQRQALNRTLSVCNRGHAPQLMVQKEQPIAQREQPIYADTDKMYHRFKTRLQQQKLSTTTQPIPTPPAPITTAIKSRGRIWQLVCCCYHSPTSSEAILASETQIAPSSSLPLHFALNDPGLFSGLELTKHTVHLNTTELELQLVKFALGDNKHKFEVIYEWLKLTDEELTKSGLKHDYRAADLQAPEYQNILKGNAQLFELFCRLSGISTGNYPHPHWVKPAFSALGLISGIKGIAPGSEHDKYQSLMSWFYSELGIEQLPLSTSIKQEYAINEECELKYDV